PDIERPADLEPSGRRKAEDAGGGPGALDDGDRNDRLVPAHRPDGGDLGGGGGADRPTLGGVDLRHPESFPGVGQQLVDANRSASEQGYPTALGPLAVGDDEGQVDLRLARRLERVGPSTDPAAGHAGDAERGGTGRGLEAQDAVGGLLTAVLAEQDPGPERAGEPWRLLGLRAFRVVRGFHRAAPCLRSEALRGRAESERFVRRRDRDGAARI